METLAQDLKELRSIREKYKYRYLDKDEAIEEFIKCIDSIGTKYDDIAYDFKASEDEINELRSGIHE